MSASTGRQNGEPRTENAQIRSQLDSKSAVQLTSRDGRYAGRPISLSRRGFADLP